MFRCIIFRLLRLVFLSRLSVVGVWWKVYRWEIGRFSILYRIMWFIVLWVIISRVLCLLRLLVVWVRLC